VSLDPSSGSRVYGISDWAIDDHTEREDCLRSSIAMTTKSAQNRREVFAKLRIIRLDAARKYFVERCGGLGPTRPNRDSTHQRFPSHSNSTSTVQQNFNERFETQCSAQLREQDQRGPVDAFADPEIRLSEAPGGLDSNVESLRLGYQSCCGGICGI
jgi:hypothetical protein